MNYEYSSQIESEYGLMGPLTFDHIHDGPDNDVYIITDSKSDKYVLRQCKREGKSAAFELEVLAALARSSFSSPEPLKSKSGLYSVVIEGIQFTLFTFIDGIQIETITPEHLETNTIEIGARKLGELHTVTNKLQVEATPARTLFTEFDRLLKLDIDILKHFKDGDILLDQVKTFYGEAQSRIDSGRELYGVTHGDYRIQNLIYKNNDCSIIDFDWSCYGPLSKDVGHAIAEWSMFDFKTGPSQVAIDKFINGYNETAPRKVAYDKDLIFWICFACLSDSCTFFADVAHNNFKYLQYPTVINNTDQCYMYKKFKYFYSVN